MPTPINRRRFLAISAASLALGSLGSIQEALASGTAEVFRWKGVVLGGAAEIALAHQDQDQARDIVKAAIAEITRLEKIFSLYRGDSELVRLNRHGFLEDPAPELVELLHHSRNYHTLTFGAFDISVQPLWSLYQSALQANTAIDPHQLKHVQGLVGHLDDLEITPTRVRLPLSGMALTFNGIAQGFITDKVSELMKSQGVGNVLVDLGEIRALGQHPQGRPWRVGLPDMAEGQGLDLSNKAIATSRPDGTLLQNDGTRNHLFDPITGGFAQRYQQVSVIAPTATQADALSTACNFLSPDQIHASLAMARAERARLVLPDGTITQITAG